jgi:uncharacterized protein (TIGR02246 family)
MTSSDPTGEEHAAISNLFAHYCLALDHDDAKAWISLFTDDGSFEVYGRAFVGHEELLNMMTAAPKGLHLGGAPTVEMLDEDQALTQQNLLFIDSASGESRGAVYTDHIVRVEGFWKFRKRRCRFVTANGLSDRPQG